MWTLFAIIGKDLRLLWRDRAGLIFLTVAPMLVITVAGFSLANLYGADPTGQTAYQFPLVDEDHSALSRAIADRLRTERAVEVLPVKDRAAAQALIHGKQAGSALVVPHGTEAALAAGAPARLILYTDPVKYLERLNVRARLLEARDALAAERRRTLSHDVDMQREELRTQLQASENTATATRAQLEGVWTEARRQRAQTIAALKAAAEQARRQSLRQIEHEIANLSADTTRELRLRVASMQSDLHRYFDTLTATRNAFEQWIGALKRLAGSHAKDIPPPPTFPELPPALRHLADDTDLLRLPAPKLRLQLAPLDLPNLPPLPPLPVITFPEIALPAPPHPPAVLGIQEVNLDGGPETINTFDQNVPGFSVTFLLLGMLLGVSLGLLDERDWGTFDRLRTMPIAAAYVLVGKLLSRFLVGVAQMLALLAVGWCAFDISLGVQPWALLLPIVGIVFAGTAFGLIVAGVAKSREAVLPLGSIVIVTMAAVGGCWWPIDLEPRWMRTVALAFPTTWAMDALNDLMIRRRAVDAALVPTAVMLAYGSLYLALGLWLFRRSNLGRKT